MARIPLVLFGLVFAFGVVAAEGEPAPEPVTDPAQVAARIAYWQARDVPISEKFRGSVAQVDLYAKCYLEAMHRIVTGEAVAEAAAAGELTTEDAGARFVPGRSDVAASLPVELPTTETTAIRTTATVPDGGSLRIGGHTGGGVSTVRAPGAVGRSSSSGSGQTVVETRVIELE